MATVRRTDALPPINYLDLEKIKSETSDYGHRHPSSVPTNMPAPSLISPSTLYSGPPPPYSYPSSGANSVVGVTGYISPTESRRMSNEDKEPSRKNQSLPSIHEALHGNQTSQFTPAPPATAPPTSHPVSIPTPTTPVPRSQLDPFTPGPPNPYAHSQPPMSYPTSSSVDRLPQSYYQKEPHSEVPRTRPPGLVLHESAHPSLHAKRAGSPTTPLRPPTQHRPTSPTYTQTTQPTSSMPPQHVCSTYPSSYSYAPQTPGVHSSHHPYFQQPVWRSDGSEIDRAEEGRKAAPKTSSINGGQYGESVKRHLDIFDLETSLNEIAEGSGRALDFSRHYGARAHQTQRSGPLPGSLPSLTECDDIIRHQTRVLDSMARIRDIIITQQHALAEQRNRDQAYKPPSEFSEDANAYQDKADGGGGFAGADAKKRRGRNAPPGRCHSCNRAETPEWRRGPDGARTLCNACGLHYAKLTRKMGSKASLGSSNLRPKEGGPGSPT